MGRLESVRCPLCLCVLAACNDAVVLTVASDRPVPAALDAICIGVAGGGGQAGHRYPIDALPQTLRVEPGSASSAIAFVRGDRGGVPAARAEAPVDFAGDVTVALDRCVVGPAGAPTVRGMAGPASARLVASVGAGGSLVVAIGATAQVMDAVDGALVAPDAPAGNVTAAIAVDIDGDCDDDAIVATDASPPTIWRRDGQTFVDAGTIGDAPVAAIAAADVDGDGAMDLVMGGALTVWINDGSGTFVPMPGAIASSLVPSALATGDLDGDGRPDLIAGQHGGPLAAWLGTGGAFAPAPAVVPPVSLDVRSLQLVDADGDFDPDLAVAVTSAPMRLYIDRDGLLEDQSFVRLASPPVTAAIAIGGWDPGCEPDLVVGGATYTGEPIGAFAREGDAPDASDAVFVDLDDDGALDAVVATDQGVAWLAR